MLNRRLLRVKVMQVLYAYHKNDDTSIQSSEKELFHSISESHDLYFTYMLLLLEIKDYAEGRIEFGKNKKIPNIEDLNPNMRFVNNKVLQLLTNDPALSKFTEQNGNNWLNYKVIVKNLYKHILESTQYKEYMSADTNSFETDKKFIIRLLEKVIAYYESIYSTLEEQSIYWNDEVEFVLSMVTKTIKGINEEDTNIQLMDEFKDEDDELFVKNLLRKSLINHSEYYAIIKKYSKNWEVERVAFMDIILMEIALAEIVEFPNIPLKVSINEYIEIAKHYSTDKSGVFINGILDKAIKELRKDGKITKTGDD